VPLEEVYLVIAATFAGAKNYTIKAGANPPALNAGQGDLVIAINNTTKLVGPLTSARFVQKDGSLNVDVEAAATGTIAAIHVPRRLMADEKKESVTLVGEGGSEITMELPLPAVYVEQINKGTLVPADEKAAASWPMPVSSRAAAAATAPPRSRRAHACARGARRRPLAAKEASYRAREGARRRQRRGDRRRPATPSRVLRQAGPKGKGA
jgi:hypothetical protein